MKLFAVFCVQRKRETNKILIFFFYNCHANTTCLAKATTKGTTKIN